MKNIKDKILNYFDSKKKRVQKYLELEKAIEDKKQEAQELAKSYLFYKKDCEELIKGCVLDGKRVSESSSHVEQRFNKYFTNYVDQLGEIKKSVDDLIGKRNSYLKKHPEIKEEIKKAEEQSEEKKPKKKMKKVMDEFSRGELKTSSGEKVTDRKQAIAIAYSEAGLNKAEVDNAIVILVKGYQDGMIEEEDFRKIGKELEFFVELEKAEKNNLKGGKADNKTTKQIADKHKATEEEVEKQLQIGIKVETEHTNDKEKAKEIAMDHLMEDIDYYSKLAKIEKSEQDELEKAKIIEEPKETKRYADAIVRNSEGKILFLLRNKDSEFAPETYCLPGGHVNEGESDEDAVVRELKEETSLIAKSVFELAQASNPSICYYEVVVEEPNEVILEHEEHINYKYMNEEEWKKEVLIANLAENLDKIYNPEYKIKKL